MQKCPRCNHKLYKVVNGISFCKFCGYKNDPNFLKNKKGAMEISVGTIVVIVLCMSLLILGIVLVKNIFEEKQFDVSYNFCYNKTLTPLYRLDLYVSEGCPHCATQKEILGPYLDEVGQIIDCAVDGYKCQKENITGVPTWKIHGSDEQYPGVHTIQEIAVDILDEVHYDWVCEDFPTDVIFKKEYRDIDISITEALQIEEETNVSFKDECLYYGGEFINNSLYNDLSTWTCRMLDEIPVINVTDVDTDWLDENCENLNGEDYLIYRCFDEIKVREKNV